MEQRTSEWYSARCGSLGASQVQDVIAKTKSGWGASRANVKAQIVCERLTGQPTDSYQNAAMLWGIEKEAEARSAYCFHYDHTVIEVGLVKHPTITFTHASPDGLVGDNGLVEIKAPNSATHIDTLLSGKVPEKYVTQMMWQMACCDRDWCDFVSYDPRLPEEMRLFVQRIERSQDRVRELESEVASFLNEVADTVDSLRAKFSPIPPESENLIKLVRAG